MEIYEENQEKVISSCKKNFREDTPEYLAIRLIRPGSKVLSLGCGSGREVKALLERNCKVTAIDLSKRMIEESKKMNPGARHIVGDMTSYDYPERYDYIVCLWNVINCLVKEDRIRFINYIQDYLTESGLLLITSSNMLSGIKNFLSSIGHYHQRKYTPFQIKKWFRGSRLSHYKFQPFFEKGYLIIGFLKE